MKKTETLDNLTSLIQISNDLSRFTGPTIFIEEVNFRCDSGYDLDTLYQRALGCLNRAFGKGGRVLPGVAFQLEHLPLFNPSNKIRVTIEVLADNIATDYSVSKDLDRQTVVM